MGQDDLLTEAESAYLEEDGSVVDDAEEELVAGIEPEEGEAETEEPQKEEDHIEIVDEAPETVVEPLPSSGRYPEVTMTDTVPKELEEAMTVLAKKFDDSEIDITEYLKQRAIIDRQVTNFQIEEANEHKFFNNWMDAQDNFLNENRQYVDNKILFTALDSAVADVKADPRSRGLSPAQIMSAADYLVRDAFGQAQRQPQEETKSTVRVAKPTNNLPNLPTLDRIPASSQNDTGLDPFSAIERLTGDAKEAAVAKLTPEQFSQYLAS